jgi:UDP-N-acetylmuramate dehydrogenase
VHLANLTTIRVGGPAREYVVASTEAEFIDSIRAADSDGVPLLVIGGGSNLVVSDGGFPGLVLRDGRTGHTRESEDACGGATVTAVAGHSWDDMVAEAVEHQWVGLEAMSGIPGTVGAAPVQNIGAYGAEAASVILSVKTWDRLAGRIKSFTRQELDFGYRTSALKRSVRRINGATATLIPLAEEWGPTPRFVVLDVTFQMRLGRLSVPIAYAELARTLGVEAGRRAPSGEVRDAVLAIRAGKGMLEDGAGGAAPGSDHDRWSAGSFFTNPILDANDAERLLPADAPRYPVKNAAGDATVHGLVKTSAAWLIDNAGFHKGFGVTGPDSNATLSTKHTLALTNRGNATATDVVELARAIRAGVHAAYGVDLEPEPNLVGVAL